jgi:DNA-binding transcriptional regulator YiaG
MKGNIAETAIYALYLYTAIFKAMTAHQFRAVLARLKLPQRQLALRLDVSVTTVNAWARGRRPVPAAVALLLDCWRRDGVPRK